uniref:uncharacterized protein LOC128929116 n=1 Tax=Callithrix jacchus TaxID=9483 RepID=UPI0023DD215A|nr:uncharacterized protein LOC128929116 [Callithrix jacchus]
MAVPICSSPLTQVCCSGRLWGRRGRFLLKRGSWGSMVIPGPFSSLLALAPTAAAGPRRQAAGRPPDKESWRMLRWQQLLMLPQAAILRAQLRPAAAPACRCCGAGTPCGRRLFHCHQVPCARTLPAKPLTSGVLCARSSPSSTCQTPLLPCALPRRHCSQVPRAYFDVPAPPPTPHCQRVPGAHTLSRESLKVALPRRYGTRACLFTCPTHSGLNVAFPGNRRMLPSPLVSWYQTRGRSEPALESSSNRKYPTAPRSGYQGTLCRLSLSRSRPGAEDPPVGLSRLEPAAHIPHFTLLVGSLRCSCPWTEWQAILPGQGHDPRG